MEYIHATGTKVHCNNPKFISALADNALYTNLAPEDFICTFLGFDVANLYHFHYSPPETFLRASIFSQLKTFA
jgi:hypothetical protein